MILRRNDDGTFLVYKSPEIGDLHSRKTFAKYIRIIVLGLDSHIPILIKVAPFPILLKWN